MTDTQVSTAPVGKDLSDELYREYEFGGSESWNRIHYRILEPQKLFTRSGGSTHRVLDAMGVVHCLPAPGLNGCVLRWKPRDGANPVAF